MLVAVEGRLVGGGLIAPGPEVTITPMGGGTPLPGGTDVERAPEAHVEGRPESPIAPPITPPPSTGYVRVMGGPGGQTSSLRAPVGHERWRETPC